MANKKKDKLTLAQSDIIRYIANNSPKGDEKLTQAQVRSCFKLCRQMIDEIVDAPDIDDYEIPIPYLGVFYFLRKKGRKAGTYKMCQRGSSEISQFSVEQDEPDFLQVRFRVSHTLCEKVKAKLRG